MKFDYASLLQNPQTVNCLEVQSFEMGVYLVQLTIGVEAGMVYENEQLKRFKSAQQIREAFENMDIKKAVMKHDSPYDEMIGNPPKADNPMVLPFCMTQPY